MEITIREVHTTKSLPLAYFDFKGTLEQAKEALEHPRKGSIFEHVRMIYYYIGQKTGWYIIALI